MTQSNGQEPKLLYRNGRLMWVFADGREMPIIAGGQDDPPADDPPGGDGDSDADDDGGGDDDGDDDSDAIKSLKEELRKTRREAAKHRTELRKLQDAEEKRKRAQMDEAERLKLEKQEAEDKAAELETRLRTATLRNAVLSEATKAKFADPEDAWRMIDLEALDVDEDGKVNGADNAVKKLAKDKPYLLDSKQAQPPGGNPRNPRPGGVGQVDDQAARDAQARVTRRQF